MTIRVTITTPDNKQARVTHGTTVETVPPSTTREIAIHDGNPSVTILEQSISLGDGGTATTQSGGGGHGVPGNGGG